jgi:hypothetical protein
MDVLKALRELYVEKSRLDRLIAICESKIKEQDRRLSRSKRGRKSMSADERKVVSERMRNYWAKRRNEGHDEDGGSSGEDDPAAMGQLAAVGQHLDRSGERETSAVAVSDQTARAASSS